MENVLMGKCLNRRIENMKAMNEEVKAWENYRNNKRLRSMAIYNARIKLKRLYPTIIN